MSKRSLLDLREGLEGFTQPPYLSIKGGNFVLSDKFAGIKEDVSDYDKATKQKFVDLIVVDVSPIFSKVYYEEEFDDSSPIGPACFSDNKFGPSINADKPQANLCRQCPHNEWGTSLRKGSRGKACKEHKKLAVMVPCFSTEHVWLVRVPPTSKGALSTFTRQLDGIKLDGRATLPIDTMTRLSFSAEKMFSIEFKVLRSLHDNQEDEALYQAAVRHFESGITADIIGLNDKPIEPMLALPAPQAPTQMQRIAPPERPREAPPVRPSQDQESDIIDVEGVDVSSLPRRAR